MPQTSVSETALSKFVPIRPTPEPVVTYFQPTKKAPKVMPVVSEEFITDEYCVDQESVRRKFGWSCIGDNYHIPYLYRNNEKYCAVRMLDKYIYEAYLCKISDNIYCGCTNINGYYATVPEVVLLNEINEFHCDNHFGVVPFKQGDVLVKLDDAVAFYQFLVVCSNKLFDTPCDVNRCGFLTINEKSMVPYVIVKGQKWVPYFYFDGMDGIKFKMQTLRDWDLSYLIFCFKVHGIRDEFCLSGNCRVILFDELLEYLDPDDCFKECWPTLERTNKNIFQGKKINKLGLKVWHLHPITVLPVSTIKDPRSSQTYRKASTNVSNNANMYYRTVSHSKF